MWNYIIRRLLYAIPILFGVLLLTFAIFYTIRTPQDIAADKFSKGGTENDIAAWLRAEGYASLNQNGERKLDIFNRAAEQKITLGELESEISSLSYGKPQPAKRERAFRSEDEKAAYEKEHGEGAKIIEDYIEYVDTKIDVAGFRKRVETELRDANKEKLIEAAHEATPMSQESKDALKAAKDAKKAHTEALAAKKPKAEVDELKTALDSAEAAAKKVQEAYDKQIEEAIASDLAPYSPSESEILQKMLESDEMTIGTNETYRNTWVENFITYISDLLTFNFRKTIDKRDVSEVLSNGMWPSLTLMIPAFFLSEMLGVFFGLFAALFRGTKIDRALVIFSVLFMSITPVAFIIFAQKFFASDWGYFPVSGYQSGLGAYSYLALPIFIYVLITIGSHVRFNRIIMLDEVGQDYVRTAKAKGLSR
ncbi:MAG: ABC transporter permease subunit, partial [Planctomycetes bacterium]|nr:ABC transporter permease subunit [Planctomycetota bacterium]